VYRSLQQVLKRWFLTPSSGVHFDVADGVRGLAILMVVATHALYANPDGPRLFTLVRKVLNGGVFGVQIFFVLSGFLLSLPFFRGRMRDARFWYHPGYALRRVLKIFPPFYLTIVLLAAFKTWCLQDPLAWKIGLAWATGLAHFIWIPIPFNGPFWSLWVEMGFYVMLPLLFLALRRADARKTGWVLFAVLLIVPTLSRQLTFPKAINGGEWFFLLSRFPNSLDAFAWGVLFASLYLPMSAEPERWRHLARLGYAALPVLGVATAVLNATFFTGQVPSRVAVELTHLLPGLGGFLLLFFVFDPRAPGSRVFSSSALRLIGIVSFEWFLFHEPVLGFCRAWLGSAHGSVLRYLLASVAPALLTLGAAILVYYRFSLPILRWGRGQPTAHNKGSRHAVALKNAAP
jgi:peptidoglycan/LPS O-acetylase OafA/YrhL